MSDSPPGLAHRFTQAVERALGRLALTCFRHGGLTMLVLALVTGGAFMAMRNLRVSADLAELLPPSFQSVQDVEKLKVKFGGVGYVAVMAEGSSNEQLQAFADALAPKLTALESVAYVEYRRPREYFEDRAPYYLDLPDVKEMRQRIDKRADFEIAKRNSLYDLFDDMEDQEPPSLDFSDIEKKYEGRGGSGWMKAQTKSDYYLDEEAGRILVLAKPAKPSTNLKFSKEIVDEVKAVVASMDLAPYGDLRLQYGGNFTKKVDQQAMIESDLRLATLVSLLLVLGYMAFHFRRGLAVVMIILPLVMGLLWTYAVGALAFDGLNILTAFIGAILLGLGIDHGIHLLGRFSAEYDPDVEAERAVTTAFGETGRAVIVAAVTTIVGFAGLGISEFRAFREFGLLAAAGVALSVVAYATCLPALLGLALRVGWKPSTRTGLGEKLYARLLSRHTGKLLVGFAAMAVTFIAFLPRAAFNYDFRALTASNLPSFQMDAIIDGMLGHSQTPVVVLSSSREQDKAIADALRERDASLGEASTIDMVANGSDVIAEGQQAKYEELKGVKLRIRKLAAKDFEGKEREQFEQLERMVEVKPFGPEDLPIAVRRKFFGEDGTSFVLVFASVDLSDGENVSRFAEQVRGIQLSDGTAVSVAGAPMVMADIFNLVKREAPPVLMGTLFFVFLTLLLLLGSLRQAILALIPAAVSLAVTLGIAGAFGLPLNYLNIVMVPALFGTGVDGGVHLVTRLEAEGDPAHLLAESGTSVAGALITTAMGFGAMLLADHLGLQSLGQLAVLGLMANLVTCLVGLAPALLMWQRRRAEAPSGAS